FLDTGSYTVKNAVILSSAAQTLTVTGRNNEERSCSVALENVFIRRLGEPNTIRVESRSVVNLKRTTILGSDWKVRTAEVSVNDSRIAGGAIEIAQDVKWKVHESAVEFLETEGLDLTVLPRSNDEIGANVEELIQQVVPPEEKEAAREKLKGD
ncbi:MAG: hypothetical protein HKN23_11955, partial [Verrucomicrobiales bacterium]|nr:hypothetical protein [Verrucomicrobiales bacterium]